MFYIYMLLEAVKAVFFQLFTTILDSHMIFPVVHDLLDKNEGQGFLEIFLSLNFFLIKYCSLAEL